MKICHITDFLPKYHRKSGGAERACLNLIQFLEKEGIENCIISLKPKIYPSGQKFKFYGVKISEEVLGHKLSFFKRITYFDIFVFFKIKKILKKEKPDIAHLHIVSILSFSALFACKSLKIPTVFTIYDYWIFSEDRILCGKSGLARKIIFKFFLKKISAFMALSENSKNILINRGVPENKIYVIPLLMPHAYAALLSSEIKIAPFSILFAGWILPHKGPLVAVKAMKIIIKKFPEAKLFIAGMKEDKDYKNKIEEYIKENNLMRNIIWNSGNSDEEKINNYKKLFNEAAVIIVPEQWENMSPVIIAEAMMAGKIVAASRIGGIPEIIVDKVSGVLADPANPEEFALKIIELFSNSMYAEKIRKNAVLTAGLIFDSEKNVKKTILMYEKLAVKKIN